LRATLEADIVSWPDASERKKFPSIFKIIMDFPVAFDWWMEQFCQRFSNQPCRVITCTTKEDILFSLSYVVMK